jgi:hypothetical protein
MKSSIRLAVLFINDVVMSAGHHFSNHGLGEGLLNLECLRLTGKGGNGNGADVLWNRNRVTGSVITASRANQAKENWQREAHH